MTEESAATSVTMPTNYHQKVQELRELVAALTRELEDFESGGSGERQLLETPAEEVTEVADVGTNSARAAAAAGQALIIDQSNTAVGTTYLDSSTGPAFYATAPGGVTGLAGPDYGVMGHGYQRDGVRGVAQTQNGSGVRGQSPANGVEGTSVGPGNGVYGYSAEGNGTYGFSRARIGAAGVSIGGVGVLAFSREREAINAASINGDGVRASTSSSFGAAVFAENTSAGTSSHAVVALGQTGIGVYASGAQAPIQLGRAPFAGPPTTGFHAAGELHLDANADLYLCKADGTPGTWNFIA
jgi:hypothetical protein